MESKKLAVTAFIGRHAGMLGTMAWAGLWFWLGDSRHVPFLIASFALAVASGVWGGQYDITSRRYQMLTETVRPLRESHCLCGWCDGFYSENVLAVIHHEITEHTV